MSPTFADGSWKRRLLGPLGLLGLLTLASGCGLDDYEKKMRDTQVRLQEYEEDEKLLAGPLAKPVKWDAKKMQPAPIPGTAFVRPPHGIKGMPEKEARAGLLYTHLPSNEKAAGPFKRVEIAYWVYPQKQKEGETKTQYEKKIKEGQQNFTADVLRCFNLRENDKLKERQVRQPPLRSKEAMVSLKSVEFDDSNGSYSLNIMNGKQESVAVVYWIAKGQKNAAKQALQASLGWLAMEVGVPGTREKYARRNPLLILPSNPS